LDLFLHSFQRLHLRSQVCGSLPAEVIECQRHVFRGSIAPPLLPLDGFLKGQHAQQHVQLVFGDEVVDFALTLLHIQELAHLPVVEVKTFRADELPRP
jgi:hypothetical protein